MLSRLSLSIGLMTAALVAQDRFDMKVREDFFLGFAGNQEALARAMKACEAALAANPTHPEAMVWHGAGVFFESGRAVQAKDFVKAGELYQRGLDEMSAAVALAPGNIAVLIPRGATLLAASHNIPAPNGKELLKTGLADYEKVYQIQAAYFETLGGHPRSELLFGIAEGYQRLGDDARAREWFARLAQVGAGNGHRKQADEYLASGQLSGPTGCVGCHVK